MYFAVNDKGADILYKGAYSIQRCWSDMKDAKAALQFNITQAHVM